METNTWYSSSSQKDYGELFRETKGALTQEGWTIESYQNTAEVLADSGEIFSQGLKQENDTEILIIRPCKLKSTSNSQVAPPIPVIITEFSNENVVSTIGLDTFESTYNSTDEQATQTIWTRLVEVLERATTSTSADNQ